MVALENKATVNFQHLSFNKSGKVERGRPRESSYRANIKNQTAMIRITEVHSWWLWKIKLLSFLTI